MPSQFRSTGWSALVAFEARTAEEAAEAAAEEAEEAELVGMEEEEGLPAP